ncbi:hypothetical protein AQ505_16060 [Pedobacter sp. PACM 27299]|uniref:hypothetical protein n=1 Tax=Pedobacter sp. PACM 27299 TaxID=1727164 RepID=UPI0007060069|nr:hypothetical protein [Pedobacter sp. PACM 27299]ALL06867.1 hypothetical protein AQ505_16060 [Pedobacter sp. PACM 27299]
MINTKLLTNLSTPRKVILMAGILTLLISTCVIFPIQKEESNFLEDFTYTFLGLFLALLLLMIGLLGKDFFKGLLFLFFSTIFGGVCFYVAYPPVTFASFIAVWLGVPSGVVTAILFMIVNFYFLKDLKRYKLLKQIIVYFIILFIVSVLFGYGGDWSFEISQYFKNRT